MNLYRVLIVFGLVLSLAASGHGEEKQPVPSKSDQEVARGRIRSQLKADYAKTTPAAFLGLADKLIGMAVEEKDNSPTRFVLLTEAMQFSTRGGDVERAAWVSREIDRKYDTAEVKERLANALAENIGGRDRLADYRALAEKELAKPAAASDRLALARHWGDVAQEVRTDARLAAVRRARYWLCEVLSSEDITEATRAEARTRSTDVNAEIDKADARLGRFSLYDGRWVVKYADNSMREYVIGAEGSLEFDRGVSADGVTFVKKDEQHAKLARRGGAVLATFASGKVVERLAMEGEKLLVERFDPSSLYPKQPGNKGEAARDPKPASAWAKLRMGRTALLAGNLTEAGKALETAARLSPDDAEVKQARAELDKAGEEAAAKSEYLKKAAKAPELNRRVLIFALSNKGKQVGNGECWTLADEALKQAGARHPAVYVFGRELGPKDTLFPGDILQVENAKFVGPRGSTAMPHHTAVVCEVHGGDDVTLIHQNFGATGKTISLYRLALNERKEGTVKIYRPQARDR